MDWIAYKRGKVLFEKKGDLEDLIYFIHTNKSKIVGFDRTLRVIVYE